ncbi:unnamed protein product, partial [Allacma fusca]
VEKKAKRKPKDIRSREVPKEFTEITGPDGQPTIVEVQETMAVEEVGPSGNPVLVEITDLDDVDVGQRPKIRLVKKIKPTSDEQPEAPLTSIPSEDILETAPNIVYSQEMGPEGRPMLVEAKRRIVTKVKPKTDEVTAGQTTENIPETPFGVLLKSVHKTPTGKKLKKVVKPTSDGDQIFVEEFTPLELKELEDYERPELEKFEGIDWGEKPDTVKRTKKPKTKQPQAKEEELPKTHYIEAISPDGAPVLVEVKDTDLTPEEKQKLERKLERQKSRAAEEKPVTEFVEVTGPDGTPFVVQVKEAKPALTEEDKLKPKVSKKKVKKTRWGEAKEAPTTHFVEGLGPDGSPVIVEVNEGELTEDEKVTFKIKKPPSAVREADVTEADFIMVIGPDGKPMVVEIKEVLEDVPEDEKKKRKILKKVKDVPEDISVEFVMPTEDAGLEVPEEESLKVEKKQKRKLKGTPQAPDTFSDDVLAPQDQSEFRPDDLIGLGGEDKEALGLKKEKRIIVKRKPQNEEDTGPIIEEIVGVTAEGILPDDEVVKITEILPGDLDYQTSDETPEAPKSKTSKLIVKRKQRPEFGPTAPMDQFLEITPEEIRPEDEIVQITEALPEILLPEDAKPKLKKKPRKQEPQIVLVRKPSKAGEESGPEDLEEMVVPSEEKITVSVTTPEDALLLPGDTVSYMMEAVGPDGEPLTVEVQEIVEKITSDGKERKIVKRVRKRSVVPEVEAPVEGVPDINDENKIVRKTRWGTSISIPVPKFEKSVLKHGKLEAAFKVQLHHVELPEVSPEQLLRKPSLIPFEISLKPVVKPPKQIEKPKLYRRREDGDNIVFEEFEPLVIEDLAPVERPVLEQFEKIEWEIKDKPKKVMKELPLPKKHTRLPKKQPEQLEAVPSGRRFTIGEGSIPEEVPLEQEVVALKPVAIQEIEEVALPYDEVEYQPKPGSPEELTEAVKKQKKVPKIKKPESSVPNERDDLELETLEPFETEDDRDQPQDSEKEKESWSKRSSLAEGKPEEKPKKIKKGKGGIPIDTQTDEDVRLRRGSKYPKEDEEEEDSSLRSRRSTIGEEEEDKERKLKPVKKPTIEEEAESPKTITKKRPKPGDLKEIESERPELEKYEKPEWPSRDKDSKDRDIKKQPLTSSEDSTQELKDTRPRPSKGGPEETQGELPLGKGKVPEEAPEDEQVKLKPLTKTKDADQEASSEEKPMKPHSFDSTEGDVELEQPEFGKDKPKKKKKPIKASADLSGTTGEDISPDVTAKEKQTGPSESEGLAEKSQRDRSLVAPEDEKTKPDKFISEEIGPDGTPIVIHGEGVASEEGLKETDKTKSVTRKSRRPKKDSAEVPEDEETSMEDTSSEVITESGEGTSEEEDVIPGGLRGTSKRRPKGRKRPREIHYTEIVGPDGTPKLVEVKDTLALEVEGPKGTVLKEVKEKELTEEEKKKTTKVKKIGRTPKEVAEADLPSISSQKIIKDSPEIVYTEATGPDGTPVLVRGKEMTVKTIQRPEAPAIPEKTAEEVIQKLPFAKQPETVYAELIAPDGTLFLVEVVEVPVVKGKGPDGSPVLVEVKQPLEDLPEKERKKIKTIKKLRKRPEESPQIQEADLVSLPYEEIIEEAPEVVYTEATGPSGSPVLVKVTTPKPSGVKKVEKRRILKKIPKDIPEDIRAEVSPKTHFITAIGPDGIPLIVKVKESDLTPDEKEKIKIVRKIKRKKSLEKDSDLPSEDLLQETQEKQFIEIPGLDGSPVQVQIVAVQDELPADVGRATRIVTKKKKIRPEDDQLAGELFDETKRKELPSQLPREVAEVTGPDGKPTIVEVQDAYVLQVAGPDGKPVLVEIQDLTDLTDDQRTKVKKVKKFRKPRDDIPAEIPSISSEDVLEESPEIVYSEQVGTDGKPALVAGVPRQVKKLRRKPQEVPESVPEKETPVYLEVTGPDGVPVTLQVINVKPELSEEDIQKPRLSKKKVKKTRAGPKVSPTTHFIEAIGPDGSPVIVEVNEGELKEEEKHILSIKRKPKLPEVPSEDVSKSYYIEATGPDGTPLLVNVKEADLTNEEKKKLLKHVRKPKVPEEDTEVAPFIQAFTQDGKPLTVQPREIKQKLSEEDQNKPWLTIKKPTKSRWGPTKESPVSYFISAVSPSGELVIVEVRDKDLPQQEKKDLEKVLEKLRTPSVKQLSDVPSEKGPKEFIEVIGPEGTPMLVQVQNVLEELPETKKTLTVVKKVRKKPKEDSLSAPIDDVTAKELQDEIPKEFTEIIGPDGTPSLVEVQDTFVVEAFGPRGEPHLVVVKSLRDLTADEKTRVKVVKKINKPIPEEKLRSLPSEEHLVSVPEIVYNETTGPDGKPILVKGTRRLVKRPKPKTTDDQEVPTEESPTDVPEDSMKTPFGVSLKAVHVTPEGKKVKKVTKKTPEGDKVVFEDFTPLELKELEDLERPELEKFEKIDWGEKETVAKRTKKPKKKAEDQQEKEVPLTHYIEAVGPDGTPLIVEVKDTDLTPEEKQKVVK